MDKGGIAIEVVLSNGKTTEIDIEKISDTMAKNLLSRNLHEDISDTEMDDIMLGEGGADLLLSDLLPQDVRVSHQDLAKLIRSIAPLRQKEIIASTVKAFLKKSIKENNDWRSKINKDIDNALNEKLP